ncbi:hypothetical protein C8Q77DRAFT_1153837 [Trametes polyzona]|nr:hypothetical protein C8Q77DRAFT_1153837 [Trametes polyzona]
MATSVRFNTPPFSPPAREPVTPTTGLRNRGTPGQAAGNDSLPPGGDVSPASSTLSNVSRTLEPSATAAARSSLFRPLAATPASAFGTPARKVTIRVDPALVTCFDPADKELYDLWAPRP